MAFGLVAIIVAVVIFVVYSSKRRKQTEERERVQRNEEWLAQRRNYENTINRCNVIMRKHYDLIEKIGVAYTVANNLEDPTGDKMRKVVEMCLEDISNAEQFKKAYLEQREANIQAGYWDRNDSSTKLPNYESFKRLAIIFEKQNEYDNAIRVCNRAIELGFVYDGTTGQMEGRVARLVNKKLKYEAKKREEVSRTGKMLPASDADVQSAVDSFFEN